MILPAHSKQSLKIRRISHISNGQTHHGKHQNNVFAQKDMASDLLFRQRLVNFASENLDYLI